MHFFDVQCLEKYSRRLFVSKSLVICEYICHKFMHYIHVLALYYHSQ